MVVVRLVNWRFEEIEMLVLLV